jgi:hypothetical protein
MCKVQMVLGYMEAENRQGLRFANHLGFRETARITEAASGGGDIVILKMRRQDCKYTKAGV